MLREKKMKTNDNRYIKHMMNIQRLLLFTALVLPFLGFAQIEEMKTDEEVMVIAPFNPSISKAKKMDFAPEADTNKTHKLNIDYITSPKLFETNYSVEKLNAAKFVDRRSKKYAQNFIKAGYGLYNRLYGELFINNQLNKRSQIGVHANHISSNGAIDDFAYPGQSLSKAKIWAKNIKRKQTTNLALDYRRNSIHYYGFNPADYPLEEYIDDDIMQTHSHIGLNFDMQGTFDTKYRDWQIKAGYQYYWDQFSSNEHLIDINAYYETPVEWIDLDEQYVGIAFNTQSYQSMFNYQGLYPSIDSTDSYFHGVYDIAPYYVIGMENFSLELGAKLSMGLDSNTRVSVAPRIKLDVGLMGDQLHFYVDANGGFMNNSMASLAEANHFISPVLPLKYTENQYRVKGGFKGHYQSYLDYNIFVETASLKDMPMFVTDTNARFHNSFTVIYDGGQYLGTGLDLLFKAERWNIELMGKYQSFTMDTASRAWQKPSLLYKFKVGYYVLENLKVTGLLMGQGKMYHLYQGEQAMDPWMDLSLMADYHLTKNLGFFLNVTNIFSDEYRVWYNYPTQSIGFMGGLHFSF